MGSWSLGRRLLALALPPLIVLAVIGVGTGIVSDAPLDLTVYLDAGLIGPGLIAMLLVALGVILRGLRWSILLPPRAPLSRSHLIGGFAWCFLILQALPFRAGEAARPVWIKARGGSVSEVISSMVVERLLDLCVLGTLLTAVLAALPLFGPGGGIHRALVVVALGSGGLVALAIAAPRLRAALSRRKATAGPLLLVTRFAEHLARAASARRALPAVALSIAAWAMPASAFVLILDHLASIAPTLSLGVLAAGNLAGLITVSPGNLGAFEAAAVAVLAGGGIPPGPALALAITLHLVVLGGQIIAGVGGRILLWRLERRETASSARK